MTKLYFSVLLSYNQMSISWLHMKETSNSSMSLHLYSPMYSKLPFLLVGRNSLNMTEKVSSSIYIYWLLNPLSFYSRSLLLKNFAFMIFFASLTSFVHYINIRYFCARVITITSLQEFWWLVIPEDINILIDACLVSNAPLHLFE
jgi:hypothetical protein